MCVYVCLDGSKERLCNDYTEKISGNGNFGEI